MLTATSATTETRQKALRDPLLDNVKGVLITLVVAGHTIGQVTGSYPPLAWSIRGSISSTCRRSCCSAAS
jgi:hypothetical protein